MEGGMIPCVTNIRLGDEIEIDVECKHPNVLQLVSSEHPLLTSLPLTVTRSIWRTLCLTTGDRQDTKSPLMAARG